MTSLVPVLLTGTMMISGLITPLITSKWRLNHILGATQFGKFLFLFLVLAVSQIRLANIRLIFMYMIVILIALLDGFAEPVSEALIPYYVIESQLVKANSLLSSVYQFLGVGSWALGSILLTFFHINQLLIFSIILAFGASATMWMLPNTDQSLKKVSNWQQLTTGYETIRQSHLLRTVTLMDLVGTAADTVWVSSIILVFVHQVLHASSAWWGYINAGYMLGALLGSFGCYLLARRLDQNIIKSIILGSLLGSGVMLLVAFTKSTISVVIFSTLLGISTAIKDVPETTLVQKSAPNDMLVSVYALQNSIYTGVFSGATLFFGWISDILGVQTVFFSAAVLWCFIAVLAYRLKKIKV